MGDPVSVAAAAVALAETVSYTSMALFNVVRAVKKAPGEIRQIAEQMTALSMFLNTLGDTLKLNEELCRPGFCQLVQTTLHQFQEINEQLREMTDKKRYKGHKRIKWIFTGPKAKALLQKVEPIKSALTMFTLVIQLAGEQSKKSKHAMPGSEDGPTTAPPPDSFHNRYRLVAESNIETNRLVVERAQKVEKESVHERRRNYDSAIQRWQDKPDDTATWLYRLIFGDMHSSENGDPNAATGSNSFGEKPYQHPAAATDSGRNTSSELIVWNERTEPVYVLDKLLAAWTTLPSHMIASSRNSPLSQDELWRLGPKQIAEEYALEDNKDRDEKSNKNAYQNDDINAISHNFDLTSSESESENGYLSAPEVSLFSDGEKDKKPTKQDNTKEVAFDLSNNSPIRGHKHYGNSRDSDPSNHRSIPRKAPSRLTQDKASRRSSQNRFFFPSAPSYEESVSLPAGSRTQSFQNPFQENPFHVDPFQENTYPIRPSWQSSWAPSQPNIWPPPPPPLPTQTTKVPHHAAEYTHISEASDDESILRNAKRDQLHSKVEELLKQRSEEDKSREEEARFTRLENLIKQDMHGIDNIVDELDISKIITAIKERDEDDRIAQLETLLIQQKEDQIRREKESENRWRAERAEWQAKVAQDAAEAKHLAEKEIASAKSAKKAAEKALKFAKEQAEKRVQREAEAKAIADRRNIEEEYKKQLENYEQRLYAFSNFISESHTPQSIPLRRTCISENGRQIEVSEFRNDGQNPFMGPQLDLESLWTEFAINSKKASDKAPSRFRIEESISSTGLNLPVPSSSQDTQSSLETQKVIAFTHPPNKCSRRTAEMQTALTRSGFSSTFSTREEEFESIEGELVRSTVFWEPPVLTLGSELLGTLRQVGWQPFYMRASDYGQTYFLGDRPVHVNFFRPEYRPQFSASEGSSNAHYLVIGKDLVEEYALLELGFQYKSRGSAAYALDCQLTASDVEALVERSFMIRETNFRRQHRQLQWMPVTAPLSDDGMKDDDDGDEEPSMTFETSASMADDGNNMSEMHQSTFNVAPDDTTVQMQDPSTSSKSQVNWGVWDNTEQAWNEIPDVATKRLEDGISLRLRRGSTKQHID